MSQITEEVGKGDGVVETDTSDTSDTLTPGEGGSCGAGGDFGGGREIVSHYICSSRSSRGLAC